MENRLKYLLLLSGFIFHFACQTETPRTSKQKDLNPAIKSKQVDWLKMTVKCEPIFNQMSSTVSHTNDLSVDSNMIHFEMRLEVLDELGKHIENYAVQSKFEQDQRIQYLAFNMQNDLYLEQDDKIIPCNYFHFERNFNLTPYRTFLIGFPAKNVILNESLRFVFESEYLEIGPMKLKYNLKEINDSTKYNS